MPEVDPKRKKNLQELIDRMGKGFDENLLDPLVDSIVNEPDKPLPSESQVKAKKIKYQVIEVSPTGKGEDLASFFGAKIGESFSMAAKARRADKGLAKPSMFYLGKALGNQFGGDLVNRTKGYVSANPDDTQDPALSRSQRFTASVQPFMGEQGPLPAPVQGPERTGIRGAFDKVAEQFDQLIALRKQKAEQSKVANQIQQIEVKEATEEITENNELKKKSTEIQKDFIAFNREQQGDAEILEVETTAEERDPMADTLDIDNRRDEEEGEDDDRDGGNKFTDFLDFGLDLLDGGEYFGRRSASVGRRGMGRVVQRTALRLGGKKLAKSAVVQGSQALLKKVALPLLRPIFKRIPLVGGLIDFVVSLALGEPIGRAAAKAIGATLGGALGTLIPIPGVGTIAGGILGDIVGGAIYDAATGGAPKDPTNSSEEVKEAAGAPSSFADQSGGLGSPDPPPEKLASGGIMAGEAGPEAVFSLSSTEGRKVVDEVSSVQNTSMSALPFILGITQNVTSLISGPAKPYIQQEIGTLERLFGIAKFNVSEVVGKGIDAVKSVGQNLNIEIPGTNTGGDDGVEATETIGGSPITPVNVPSGDVKERAKVAFQFYKSKGFSDSGAAYMVGNLMQESTLNPAANGDNGHAWGLAQWRDDAASGARWIKYKEWAAANNKQPGDFYAQLEYTVVEGASYGIERMKGNDVEKHKQFVKAYEGYSEEGSRFGFAQDIINNIQEYKGAVAPVMTPPPSSTPAPTESQSNDEDGGHNAENPGPADATPAEAPQTVDSSSAAQNGGHTPENPGPVATALAPMPMHLQESDKKSHITVQPIIYEGSSTPIGYQKNIDTGGGQMARFFYDKTGEKTTLVDLKAARLQTN
ncbi:hypothetical protein Syn1_012 [Prochlorococcus phage Syn1]|uniref:Phage tail lysozyme domain-containing protein n=1 Tax=Prochlorococcus phage Syn1 TaxID=444861 RepID=E3SP98_9CAUD|nr:hypothetical protein Syn1_012 [Prochlorococcus phage Syn1]ADO99114.1 hypothetical protein Syn1_012 [Prochlorococcus phage Syn1]